MRFIFTLLIFCFSFNSFGQAKDSTKIGSVLGIVKDSANEYGLQSVTITIYQKSDSTLLDYQLTNPQGEFNIQTIPVLTPVIVNFSFTGYMPFSKTLQLDSTNRKYDFKTIMLARSYGSLDEVVVQAVLPIRMNGDTLEINPTAFKLDSNAVVEDMLRRVPGVTMWGDGTITVNGKTVNKVFVDGKPFFGGDPAIATQNLPKNAIEKIQVYQEQDYTKDNIDQNPTDSLLTMNIKLREDKKFGLFGKVGAGIGTDHRYEADGTMQAYNRKNRFSLAAASNNINKSVDMQSIVRQGSYRDFNPSNRYVANFGGSGVNRIGFIGANYMHNFSQENNSRLNNQLNAGYNFRSNINDVSSQTSSQSNFDNRALSSESERESHSENRVHSVNTSYNKRDRSKDFNISSNYSNTSGNSSSSSSSSTEEAGVGLVNTNQQTSTNENSGQNISFNTSYRNNDDDERNLKSFNINYNANYSENNSTRNTLTQFTSYAKPSDSRYFNRNYDNESSNFNNSLGFGYNALKRLLFGSHNLWDVNIIFDNNLSVSKNNFSTAASDYDTLSNVYLSNDSLTYYNDVTRIEDRPSLRFSKNFRKNLSDRYFRYLNISAVLQGHILSEKNRSDIDDRNLDRTYSFFLPGLNISYNYNKFRKYNLSFNLSQNNSAGIPSIDQLRPIIDSSQSSFNNGNPYLKPFYNNNLSFTFNYEKQSGRDKGEFNFRVFLNAGRTRNGITDSSYLDQSRRRITYLINLEEGRRNMNGGLSVNKAFKLKKDMLQFTYSWNYSNNRTPNYFLGDFYRSKNTSSNNNLRVFYSVGDIATFQVAQGLNLTNSLPRGENAKPLKNTTYITNAGVNLKYPKNFTLSNTFDYVNNKQAGQTSALWNAFLTYRFLKTKSAEVKLSAMDILRQNKNIDVNTGLNSLSTTVTNGLQNFYMVTLSYYPRRFGRGSGSGNREMRTERSESRPANFQRRGADGGGFRGGSDRPRRN
ncbi:MAG: hypothetical protein ABS67_02220 [Niabella sp. SCN 42-15]|nr:MAG: hypothetical protein ABS67_02220 [Niabella sp. SCN 42-15]